MKHPYNQPCKRKNASISHFKKLIVLQIVIYGVLILIYRCVITRVALLIPPTIKNATQDAVFEIGFQKTTTVYRSINSVIDVLKYCFRLFCLSVFVWKPKHNVGIVYLGIVWYDMYNVQAKPKYVMVLYAMVYLQCGVIQKEFHCMVWYNRYDRGMVSKEWYGKICHTIVGYGIVWYNTNKFTNILNG